MKVKADLQERAERGTTMKTTELTGLALDWAVALAEGIEPETEGNYSEDRGRSVITRLYFQASEMVDDTYSPSTIWAQGGPIIESEISKIFKNVGGTYTAQIRHEESHPLVQHKVLVGWTNASGPTPLIAAMRCYVYSRLGNEVEIPEELV